MAIQPSEPALPTRDRDVRAARPYVFLRTPLRTFARRVLGVTSLALLDAVGLSLGLYLALVLRSVVFGDPVLWSLLWRTESEEWLPFLIPITLLVFWQAGLYATRERRAGLGRVASSLLLVALIVLAFGYGTGYDFNTTGLIPTALVVCAITMGLLRAAYDSFTLEWSGCSTLANGRSSSAVVRVRRRFGACCRGSGPGSRTSSSTSCRPTARRNCRSASR